MRYDPDDRKLYFSINMIPDKAESKACHDNFEEYRLECYKNKGSWIVEQMKDDEDIDPGVRLMGKIMGFTIFGVILLSLGCIMVKKYSYIPWIIGALMLVLGIGSVVSAGAVGVKVYQESALYQRISGIVSIAGAAGLVVVGLIYPRDDNAYYMMALFCEIAFAVFVAMIVKTIGFVTAPSNVYTEEVRATCIGYVRTYILHSPDDGSNYLAANSPVFEYYYNGTKYQSYYDLWDNGEAGEIEVGSACKIKISPDDPARVAGGKSDVVSAPLVTVLLSFAAFVMLLVLLIRR